MNPIQIQHDFLNILHPAIAIQAVMVMAVVIGVIAYREYSIHKYLGK